MTQSKTFIGAALVLILVLLVGGVALYSRQGTVSTDTTSTTDNNQNTGNTQDTGTNTTGGSVSTSPYKDGTYTATGNYVSPGGKQGLTLTVTLKDSVVTNASITQGAIDPTSKNFQDKFISGFKQVVVGKNIDALNVGVVSGSSLTGGGFNDAIAKIKTEAKA